MTGASAECRVSVVHASGSLLRGGGGVAAVVGHVAGGPRVEVVSLSGAEAAAREDGDAAPTLVVADVPSLLVRRSHSIASVLARVQTVINQQGGPRKHPPNTHVTHTAPRRSNIILINNTDLEPRDSIFSFKDLLDTLASAIYTLIDPTHPETTHDERTLMQQEHGWILVNCFILKSAGTGSFGRIRKGSFKEKMGLKPRPGGGGKILFKPASELLRDLRARPDYSIAVSAAQPTASAGGSGAATSGSNAPISGAGSAAVAGAEITSVVDPASNLSFNLRLTDEQREQRDALVLPYVHDGSRTGGATGAQVGSGVGGMGFIHYQAEAVDDDEMDPDDDLAL
ncbi:hypothetical protein BC830DRAFT_716380 [Chytriomyces sp. MP71]|nr:hypothetical protein BC830DRAFT_716380 [Chytriomyces sp. MP71]